MKPVEQMNRLFVPLAAEPYHWFESGQKAWELRKCGRQFTERQVIPGRRIELRYGYSNRERSLHGTIVQVYSACGLKRFFDTVDYRLVIPPALNQADAIRRAASILGISEDSDTCVLGMRVQLDHRNVTVSRK